MRNIDRFLAVILLVGAVGGVAVFANQSGSDSSAQAIDLAAPPLQHIGAPGTVLFAHTPAPTRVTIRLQDRSHLQQAAQQAAGQPARALTGASAGRIAIPEAPRPRPVAAAPPRIVTPTPTPTPEPVQAPPPLRALAAVQTSPAEPASKGKGHGRARGHAKRHGHDSPQALGSSVADAADVQATPVDPSQPSSDDVAENGDPNGPGNGHGHAGGHTRGRATPDGD